MASDLIYREDAKDFVRHAYHKGLSPVEYLDEVPAADVRPVVRGRWKANPHIGYKRLDEDDEPVWGYVTDFICSNCEKRSDKQTNFCQNCGADMRPWTPKEGGGEDG